MDSDDTLPRDGAIAEALATLGSPLRLSLLRQLRVPRALREIEVRSARAGGGQTLARQTVRDHLDRLLATGLVVARPAERPYGATQEFLLNHQRIFALAEDVRDLARLRAVVEPPVATSSATPPTSRGPNVRPGIVVVRGLEEGIVHPVDPAAGRTTWTIGRRRGADIPLDYDPYVSAEHAELLWTASGHAVRDLPGSRNGTTLNFHLLEKGVPAPLEHGDVVGAAVLGGLLQLGGEHAQRADELALAGLHRGPGVAL
ncbi:MAG TPA: FHA domain-containing protein, partial [Candidatus Thermoplasmatota archaeon]|nr:FHA domain-containing protein [Candidatus Thermoplasmatota archaeon]